MSPNQLKTELEGESQPTHFANMLTVVAKFVNLIRPQHAYFNKKNYQQLTLIQQMTADLKLKTTIVDMPTIRNHNGLALSSRNKYLSNNEQQHALALFRALVTKHNTTSENAINMLNTAITILTNEKNVDVDYLSLHAPNLGHTPTYNKTRLLIAARINTTQLIDNIAMTV